MNTIDKAVDRFNSGLNCSQTMLVVFGEAYGLDAETAKNLGRPLGGGIGRMGKTCGAVSGAAMIIGLANGKQDEGDARKATAALVQEFFRRFEALHRTTECKTLLGADISTEEGMKKIMEEKLFTTVCPEFVRDAASILQELLGSSSVTEDRGTVQSNK